MPFSSLLDICTYPLPGSLPPSTMPGQPIRLLQVLRKVCDSVRLSPWLEIVPEFLGQKCNVAGHTARAFHFALTLTPEHQIRPCCILGPRAQTLGPAPLPRAPCAESSYPSPSLPFPLLSPLLHFCPRLKVHPTPSCARRLTLAPGSVYICRTRSGQVQWPPRRHGLWSGA